MSDDAFHDIANAIAGLRRAFLKHHLNPPTCVELKSAEDGDRLRYSIPRDMLMAQPAESLRNPRDPDIVMHLVGMEIRYPARIRSKQGGGFEYE